MFLISCTSGVVDEVNETVNENKTNLYGQALEGLQQGNTELNKRYNYLATQIEKIDELDMGTFVQIKIELDYLSMQEYDVDELSAKFKELFAQAEEKSKVQDYSGLSLNDRFYDVERKVEQIQDGKINLTVPTYLEIQASVKSLEEDEYIESKLNDVRKKLGGLVIAELEGS